MLISEQPFVDLYDRILRVIGPLYFKFGADVLAAIFSNIQEWYFMPVCRCFIGGTDVLMLPTGHRSSMMRLLPCRWLEPTFHASSRSC